VTDRKLTPVPDPSETRTAPTITHDLSGRAAELFDELAPELELSGRLTPETAHTFRLWCTAQAVAEATSEGLEGVDRQSARRGRPERVRDPRWIGFRDASTLAMRLGKEFGLTPASAISLEVSRSRDPDIARLLS
jgi:phage terminase small subunit